jgi:hypothetical protein
MAVRLPIEGAKIPRMIIVLALLDATVIYKSHRAVIFELTRIGFVLG